MRIESSPGEPGPAQLIKVLLRGKWTQDRLAHHSAVCNRKEAEMGEALMETAWKAHCDI